MSSSIGLSHEVIGYLHAHNPAEHPVLRRCRAETVKLGDEARMQISAEQGAFMQLLAKMVHAKTVIEVGVFTGYSSLAVALAMNEMHGDAAKLHALDVSEEWTAKAQEYWRSAGVDKIVQLTLAPANETLSRLIKDGRAGPVDFAFIDADKTGYQDYYDKCFTLLRPGGIMVFDNMLWSGAVADPNDETDDTKALRAVAANARKDPRVDLALTAIGDGLLICRKR
ncbi:MAG: class I SAM-dependent methyltransferase [Caulobacterales bacterium]